MSILEHPHRPLLAMAAIVGGAGVALAAAGSHGGVADIQIAASFLQLHAPALIGISLLRRNRLALIAGWIMLVGLVLFAGDLAVRGEWNLPLFPFAAPLGGMGLIVGWLLLAVAAIWGWPRSKPAETKLT